MIVENLQKSVFFGVFSGFFFVIRRFGVELQKRPYLRGNGFYMPNGGKAISSFF